MAAAFLLLGTVAFATLSHGAVGPAEPGPMAPPPAPGARTGPVPRLVVGGDGMVHSTVTALPTVRGARGVVVRPGTPPLALLQPVVNSALVSAVIGGIAALLLAPLPLLYFVYRSRDGLSSED